MSDDDTKDMVETVDVSPREPEAPQAAGADVFRQLLHQAVRVADMANSQAMRMALDFAKVYEREQGVRREVVRGVLADAPTVRRDRGSAETDTRRGAVQPAGILGPPAQGCS